MTKFGEISPLWKNFQSLWACKGGFVNLFWQMLMVLGKLSLLQMAQQWTNNIATLVGRMKNVLLLGKFSSIYFKIRSHWQVEWKHMTLWIIGGHLPLHEQTAFPSKKRKSVEAKRGFERRKKNVKKLRTALVLIFYTCAFERSKHKVWSSLVEGYEGPYRPKW